MKNDLKSGAARYQLIADEVIQDHYLCEPLLDSSMRRSLESAANMFPQSQFAWEDDYNVALESFQDLSEYCQSNPTERNSLKLETSGSGNMSVSLDDELNTPEIGCEEAFFGGSTRLSPVLLGNEGDGWPVTVNARPGTFDLGTFDLSIPEVVHEQQLELNEFSPENSTVHLYSPIEDVKSEDVECEVTEQVDSNLDDLNIVVEREETVEMLPNTDSDIKFIPSDKTGLHLSLPSEPMKMFEVVNTPEVLNQLENPQAYFDLINFIVKDTANPEPVVESTVDLSAIQFLPRDHDPQKEVVDQNVASPPSLLPQPTNQPEEPDSEPSTSYSVSCGLESASSHIGITIKREPAGTRHSSRRKRTKSFVELFKEEDSEEEEEYSPSSSPAKRKRRSTPSCSTDGDAPCARYRELRDRNNEASRRSRQTRKAREEEMKVQAEVLERDNRALKVKCDELERQLATFRQLLVDILASRKPLKS